MSKVSDITQRRLAEEALRESEERYRRIVHTCQEGIWVMDREHRATFVNPRLAAMFGYPADEILGQPIETFMSQDELGDHQEQMRVRHQGLGGQYERRFRRKDGEEIWVLVSATALMDEQGRFNGSFAMLTDITERKHLEIELRANESLLTHAEEIIGMGSFVWDVSSDRITWSSGMGRLYGHNSAALPQDLKGVLKELIHPEDRERVGREVERMTGARRTWPIEFRALRSDGEELLIYCETESVSDDTGRFTRYVGIHHDITRRRADENKYNAMQLQLNHTSRLAVMGALAAGIAHEVNQPLCSIVNFAKACGNLASAEAADLDQIRRWSEAIVGAAGRAGDIVRRMLRFARQDATDWESVPVQRLIDEALLLIRHRAREQRVELQIQLPSDELAIEVQAVRIQQVLVNLLNNSLDSFHSATDGEARIVVSAEPCQERVAISVADNGSGMPERGLERIFDPFYTTKPEGLGLGLAISRTIVEDHGGRISAAANPDAGLTFRFTLPATATLERTVLRPI